MPHQRVPDVRIGIEDLARARDVVIGQARLQRAEILDRVEAPCSEIDRDRKALVPAEIERREPGPARKCPTRLEACDERFRRLLELDPGEFRIGREASARRQHVPDHEELLGVERIERMVRRGVRAGKAGRPAAEADGQDRVIFISAIFAQHRRGPTARPTPCVPRRHFGSVFRIEDQSPSFRQKPG